MTGQDRIAATLSEYKAAGRSSPAGLAWHEFWSWLSAAKPADTPNPPPPLILAASGESDASKHRRLRQQLEWADRHDLLDEAIARLVAIPIEQWNASSPESWNQDSYPPPWGSWLSLARGGSRRAFTRFRAAVNAAIKPHEVDHIDFDLRPL